MLVFRSNEMWLRAVVYIEDALAYKSLCHKTDPLSLELHRFLGTGIYSALYNVVVAVFWLLAFVEKPSSLSTNSDFTVPLNPNNTRHELPFGVTHSVEGLCVLLFIADFIARCRISDKRPWKCKWLLAYGIVNFLYFFSFWLFIGLRYSQLRIYRVLRPFYMIQHNSIMKKMLNAIRRSMPEVFGVLVALTLNVVIFGLIAHILFSDTIKIDGGSYFASLQTSMWNLLVLITTANNPDVMIPAYKINRVYALFFITFIWLGTYGLMNLLLAVIYNQFRQHFKVSVKELIKRRNIALRAAFEVLTNPQIGRKLTRTHEKSLSNPVCYDSEECLVIEDDELQHEHEQQEQTEPTQKCIEISSVISVLDYTRMDRRFKKYLYKHLDDAARMQTDYLDRQDFVKLFIDIETDYSEWRIRHRRRRNTIQITRIKIIVEHPIFEIIGTVLAFVNTVALLVVLGRPSNQHHEGIHDETWFVQFMNVFVTVYFVIEQVLRVLGVGPRGYITKFSYCYDMVLTGALCILMTIVYTRDYEKDRRDEIGTNLLRAINLCICFRIIRVVLQVKRLRVVVHTYLTLIKQMQVYLGILMALMYMYAIVGMELFSEDVTSEIHNKSATDKDNQTLSRECGSYWNLDYYTLNFDDFFSAVVTLFTLMVVNNWHILVDAFSYSRGTWWAPYYFISWWTLCVLLTLNVVIALIIDAFIDRWDKKDDASFTHSCRAGNVHIHQFVEASERARAYSEKEVITALHRNNIIRDPFVNINAHTPDVPSASRVNSEQIFCANPHGRSQGGSQGGSLLPGQAAR